MATTRDASSAPKEWAPPTSNQEFVFKSADNLPDWVNRSWLGYDGGPALQVPTGDLYSNEGPYTTKAAHVGDTVKFTVAKGATPAKFTVIAGEPDPNAEGEATKRPVQQTNASLEDMIKGGTMSPSDLGEDAKAQVSARSPGLKPIIEGEAAAPPAQKTATKT